MLILTLLTGIACLVLLLVLGWALAKTARALEGITGNLEKIAMGVRAIEQETAPLGSEVTALNGSFEALVGGFDALAGHLRGRAEPGLGSQSELI
jgi:uncharacterized protein YoxC